MCNRLLFLLLLFCSIGLNAQTTAQIDSLTAVLPKVKNDSVKVSVLNKLALYYLYSDLEKATRFVKQAEGIPSKKILDYGHAEAVFIKGAIFIVAGQADSAAVYYKKAHTVAKKKGFKPIEVRCINGFGMIAWNRGQFDKALPYFFSALRLNERLPEKQRYNASLFYNNIGLIYNEKRLYEKALFYYKKAYDLRVKANMLREQGVSLNNIGICYTNLKQSNLAEATFEKGLQLTQLGDDQVTHYKILHNLANLYADNGQYDKAIRVYREVTDNPNGVSVNPRDMVILYGCLANTYNKSGQYDNSLKYAQLGLDLVKHTPDLEQYADNLYNALAKSYFHKGDIKKGDYYLVKHYTLLKTLFSEESKTALAEIEVKYQTEKKEKELLLSKAEIDKKTVALQHKNAQFLMALLIGVGLLLIVYLFYRQQKLKNKQQKQEFALQAALAEIAAQSNLQEQRLHISRDLHDNIGAQLTFIISSVDSIKYAFDIQNPRLDEKLTAISQFAKSTIQELRDTVWAMNKKEISFADLQSRLSHFLENAKKASHGVNFRFDIQGDLSAEVFTTTQGMHLYRIVQEGINNALKHAQATAIKVAITKENDGFVIRIEDNGIGFDETGVTFSNGLNNLRKRAKALDAILEIASKPGSGTTIVLNFKR